MSDRETEIVVQYGVLEAGAKGSRRYFENIAIQRIVIAPMEVHYSFASADCTS
jgi:hypothetical protein